MYSQGGLAWVLGFVALVPWLLALDRTPTAAGAARSGLLMSLAFVAAVFAWFGVAIGSFTGLGSGLGVLVLLAAAPLLQPQFLAFALVRHVVGRRHGPALRALAGACAWVATEWLVPRLLGDTLGHGLHPSPVLRQVADLGGAAGLSLLLVLVNECFALALARRNEGARAPWQPVVLALGIVLLMAGYGLARLSALASASATPGTPLRVGLVQSNLYDYERLRRSIGTYAVVREVLDTHYALSREALRTGRVDALLWSETVYPTTFMHPKSEAGAEFDREIRDFVTAAGVPLVFGTYDVDAEGEYNAAAFVEPGSGLLGFYRKTRLFPLTERVPAWLDGPALRRALPWTGSWRAGDGARVFPLRLADGREVPVMPLICLDDVDAGLGIDGARLGAQAILTMSNDSWFTAHPAGARLHATVAAFRSIETRLPQFRVTANGLSAVIDETGTFTSAAAMGQPQVVVGQATAREAGATLMMAWGDWVGRAATAVLVLFAAVALWPGARSPRPAAQDSTEAKGPFRARAIVLSPAWRTLLVALELLAAAGLAWLGWTSVFGDPEASRGLARMGQFAALVLAPKAAAWSIRQAHSASVRIEDDDLVLELRGRQMRIRVADITALAPWSLGIPPGAQLRLASGRQRSQGLAIRDPDALARALVDAGAASSLAGTVAGLPARYARVRNAVAGWRIDHPALKLLLFPLLLALPAFRLHQHIAYGSTFGEYYSFGLKAYLLALAIWWAAWIVGMTLVAAALRCVVEVGTLLALASHPPAAIGARRWLEGMARALFFLGVPLWLLMRTWPG